MLQEEIHQYLESFFKENDCSIEETSGSHLTVQLTVDMDKELMNRPFYWTYLEKTGGIPNPMKVTFITNQDKAAEDLKGEIIHFGSPRLHQLFHTTKKLASHIRLYEEPGDVVRNGNIPLHPWLFVNIKLSFQCDRMRDVIRSIGLNLLNGMMIENFYEKTKSLSMKATIPDYCFTITPIIKPGSGINRIENFLRDEIESDQHPWAADAISRWEKDLELLDHFYEDYDEMPDTYEIEKNALKDQYEPMVTIDIINGGMYYLCSPMNALVH